MIGMEGATERRTKLRKCTSVGLRESCFFQSNLRACSAKTRLGDKKILGNGNSPSMKVLDGGPTISGGKIPFDRYGATRCRNRDWRVFFMFLLTEGEMTTLWERLERSGEILGAYSDRTVSQASPLFWGSTMGHCIHFGTLDRAIVFWYQCFHSSF